MGGAVYAELEPDGNIKISGCVLFKTGQGV